MSARWWAIFALLALAQQGCTIGGGGPAAPSERPLPPPPSESVRRSIREVWVAAGNTPSVLVLPAQMDKVEGTSVGAAEGFLVALAVTAEAAGPSSGDLAGAAVLLVGAVAIPVGTVAGAVADNWQGSERHAIGRHRQALVSVAKDLSLQRAAQARLVGYGSVLTPLQFHVAPTAPPGPYLPRTGTAVLEVPVERFGLTGPRARGAPLECFILARVALWPRPGGAVAYRHVWVHRSGSAPLDEWTGNGDHRFRAGLELCQRGLVEKVVEKVVEELFLVHVPGTKGRP